jgi:two-component system cell cycle response regulator
MTGDMVLKAVSGVLLKCTRRGDVCCRYGGDEFSVTLPNTDRMQAAAIAERIRQEVCALKFESDSGEFGVTLSIGVAELASDMTADMFKKITDKTLYYSKNTGKNRITVYNNAQNISI